MYSSFIWAFTALIASQLVSMAPAPQSISKSTRCGPTFGLTCRGSTFGDCCSQYNYCGSTSDHCSSAKGCQSGWGQCSSASTSSAPPVVAKISKDGKCGPSSGICKGSSFGDCCSQHGWCGTMPGYCQEGCNTLFGSCSRSPSSSSRSQSPVATRARSTSSTASATTRSSTSSSRSSSLTYLPTSRSSSSPSPIVSGIVSQNGRCGTKEGASPKGMTCRGSQYGNCCSKWGYCGSTEAWCGDGCQPGFGDCKVVSPASTTKKSSSMPSSKAISSTSAPRAPSSTSTSKAFSSSSTSLTSSFSTSTSKSSSSSTTSMESFQPTSSIGIPSPPIEATPSSSSLSEVVSTISSTTASPSSSSLAVSSTVLAISPSATSLTLSTSVDLSSSFVATIIESSSVTNNPNTSPLPSPSSDCPLTGRPSGGWGMHYELTESSSPSACQERCRATRCQYFVLETIEERLRCMLFDMPISQDLPIYPDSSYRTYDVSCPQVPSDVKGSSSSTMSSSSMAPTQPEPVPTPTISFITSPTSLSSSIVVTTLITSSSSIPTPSQSAAVCAVIGSPRNGYANYYYSSGGGDSLALCQERCFSSTTCTYLSMEWTEIGWICHLSGKTLAEYLPFDRASNWITYERGCLPVAIVSSSSIRTPISSAPGWNTEPETPTPIVPSPSPAASSSSSTAAMQTSIPVSPCSTPFTPSGQCNVAGAPSGARPDNTFDISPEYDADACGRRCRSFPRCQYFILNKVSEQCWLYDRPLAGDLPLATTSSYYLTSEASCYAPVCSSTPISTPAGTTTSSFIMSSTSIEVASQPATTPSSSPTPACATTSFTPSGQCNVKAVPTRANEDNAFDISMDMSLEQCGAMCRTFPQCQFLFLLDNTCFLYDRPLAEDLPFYEFDSYITSEVSCFPPVCPSSAPAISSI